MRFLVFFEKAPGNYCAFVPNLPVICLSTGKTVEEIHQNIREAMESHIELMLEDGETVIEPSVWEETLEFHPAEDGVPLIFDVVVENSPTNNAAYCPDIPGCWATGRSLEEAREELRQVVQFRLAKVEPDGETILPDPQAWGEFVDIPLPVLPDGIPRPGA